MSKGWMRVREAAALLCVSESTIRRRVAEGELRGRSGRSGRQEVFLSAKLREQASQQQTNTSAEHAEAAPVVTQKQSPVEAASTSESQDDMIKRYERMAGGSLLLAQKRADELTQAASAAYENLAHARHQLRQARKFALAGWGTAAGAILFAFICSLSFGLDSASSHAKAQASERVAEQSAKRIEELQRQLAEAKQSTQPDAMAQALVEQE